MRLTRTPALSFGNAFTSPKPLPARPKLVFMIRGLDSRGRLIVSKSQGADVPNDPAAPASESGLDKMRAVMNAAAAALNLGGFKSSTPKPPPPPPPPSTAPSKDGPSTSGRGNESSEPSRTSIVDDMLSAFRPKVRLAQELQDEILTLPGTKDMSTYADRIQAMSTIKESLSKGILPDPKSLNWPQEPFKSTFLGALSELEMARFCRRYPALLDTLLRQMLNLVRPFEAKLAEQEAKAQKQKQQKQQQQQSSSKNDQDGEESEEKQQGGDEGDENEDQKEQQQGDDNEKQEGGGEGKNKDQQISMESEEHQKEQAMNDIKAEMEQMAKDLVEEFKKEWEPVMDNVEKAAKALDDLDGLMDGPDGFDLSSSLWKKTGWREVDDLRKKLENLRELRDLVRRLGRGGGKGPKRRAPEEIEVSGGRPGLVRSTLVPEETRGLTRSGDLSRMLPSEVALLAAGWPRYANRSWAGSINEELSAAPPSPPPSDAEVERRGSQGARRLHLVRRAERQLMSYERTGWLEQEPSRLTGRKEIRPAADMGPIILCLDTSGSMRGSREVVAKALALEVLRGANRQGRQAYLISFSGPGQVQELELKCDAASMAKLLDFLSNSFEGGTDVDAPLEVALERLEQEAWALADILMVSDGEISPPSREVLEGIQAARETLGLKVHGLLVGKGVTEAMQMLCSETHVFKSWSAVGGRDDSYY